ncbi:MAG TPA: Gfo/Idh/MocA family oxidoreductase [Jatrophihabitans sp.]|jgi:predicted dehydrogenase
MTRQPLGIAVIGYGWMGRAHTHAHSRLLHHFPELSLAPQLLVVADPEPDRLADAQDRYGFVDARTKWQDVLTDERIGAVSITAPNFLHREIGVAMAEAGKHIWIEKPVGLQAADAQAVASAVTLSGVQGAVGFNYRNAPAVEHARSLIQAGAIGQVTNASFRLLSDYAAHPQGALSWRFETERGGPGVLGDLASHGVDLARFLLGDIASLVAETAIFVPTRPRPTGTGSHFALAAGGELGTVQNEDYLNCLLRFTSGARGSLEASRVSVGDQNNYGFVVHGSRGMLAWDFRRMGELITSIGEDYINQPATTLYIGPGHGEFEAFQPGAGIPLGYDDLKVIEAARFVSSITDGKSHGATLADAVHSANALQSMVESAATGSWVPVAG